MNARKDPMLKLVRVPSLLEPSSTRTGTGFHPYWNWVPPVLCLFLISLDTFLFYNLS